jgi:putative ABC transport system permease protein
VKSHIERQARRDRDLKALGATGGRVFAIYLSQVLLLSALGARSGSCSARRCRSASPRLRPIIPLPIAPALQPVELLLAFCYGLLTALAFALWPLGRAHDVPVSALFRDAVSPSARWPRWRYVVATALVVRAARAIAVSCPTTRKIAAIFIGAAAAVFVTLQAVALLLMAMRRRLPHAR